MTHQELAAKYAAITDIKERRRAFLDDIAAFYNFTNRAVDDIGQCTYYPLLTSPGCAIGRCIDPAIACKMHGAVSHVRANNPLAIPEWMDNMGTNFLSEVQALHDCPYYWDTKGLSGAGFAEMLRLKGEYLS